MNSFYSDEELAALGLKRCGTDVKISRHCSIYGAESIEIGSHVRVDDFCILSGRILLGDYIHISAYACIFAGVHGVTMEDFSCLSSRVAVYALNDDYSGENLTNSTIPAPYRVVDGRPVRICRHVIIGSGSTVLPGVTVGTGASIGAMTLVREDIPEWTVCVGIPARMIKARSRGLLEKERLLLAEDARRERETQRA